MPLTKDDLVRYDRNILLQEVGEAGQEILLHSKVLIIGAGGLGSAAAFYLAAAGVGTLGIADGDRVDLSNLQRQILHGVDNLGQEKVTSAGATLRSLNPELQLQLYPMRMTEENLERTMEPYQILLDCTDRFASKFLINDVCVKAGKPYVHGGVLRYGGQVMTYVPGQGPCLRCLLGDGPAPEEDVSCAQVGVLGAAAGVLGSIQAMEAVKYLLGIGQLLVGKILLYDGLNLQFRISEMPHADPNCSVCGTLG